MPGTLLEYHMNRDKEDWNFANHIAWLTVCLYTVDYQGAAKTSHAHLAHCVFQINHTGAGPSTKMHLTKKVKISETNSGIRHTSGH
jgi:hypothetical protein